MLMLFLCVNNQLWSFVCPCDCDVRFQVLKRFFELLKIFNVSRAILKSQSCFVVDRSRWQKQAMLRWNKALWLIRLFLYTNQSAALFQHSFVHNSKFVNGISYRIRNGDLEMKPELPDNCTTSTECFFSIATLPMLL